MKRQGYQKPATKVILLRNEGALLTLSGKEKQAAMKDYDWNTEVEE